MKYTILIAEDDSISAFAMIQEESIDLAILDIMMPEMDGYDLEKKIRGIANISILSLSAKNQDADKPLEILARVQANLRRFYHLGSVTPEEYERSEIRIGEITLNIETLKLYKNNEEIIITPMEYKALGFLK